MRRFCIVLGCICAFWIWLFYIDVFAMTKQEYEQEILSLLYDFKNGTITYEQYKQYSDEVTNRYVDANTDSNGVIDSVAVNVTNTVNDIVEKIGESIQKSGNAVCDWLDDAFNDYETSTNVSTTDKKGYTTMIKVVNITTPEVYQIFYWDGYIEVEPMEDGTTDYHCRWKGCERYRYTSSFGAVSEGTSTPDYDTVYSTDQYTISVYGDVRYLDGSEAPTDDEYTTQDTLDLTGLSDSELEELLEDINEELERQNPDLSNIEGLLEAIYYRLGTLDSDNDNDLLSQVLVAIQSLEMNNDNSDLLALLKEIRDSLKDDGSEDTSEDGSDTSSDESLTEFQKKILEYISPGDVSEFEEFAINVRGLFYSKFSFIYEFQAFFSSLSWNSPESIVIVFSFMENTYEIDTSVYNELMPTVRGMLAFFVYGVFCIRSFKRMPTIISGGGDE